MALHGGIARHAGDFGARVVWNAAIVYSSERPSPSQFPNGFSDKGDQRRHSANSLFCCRIADLRAQRRA